ncbi:MAG: hypothetical protein OXM87_04255 [Truepera sp.]|nr:hypothetical protein [Truepera sp.]
MDAEGPHLAIYGSDGEAAALLDALLAAPAGIRHELFVSVLTRRLLCNSDHGGERLASSPLSARIAEVIGVTPRLFADLVGEAELKRFPRARLEELATEAGFEGIEGDRSVSELKKGELVRELASLEVLPSEYLITSGADT